MSQVKTYIGTSLSFCMQDILAGRVSVDEISAIVTSTAFKSSEEAFNAYYESYWNDYSKLVVKMVLDGLWPLICQPRLQVGVNEHRGHYAGKGFWLNTQTGEYTKHLITEVEQLFETQNEIDMPKGPKIVGKIELPEDQPIRNKCKCDYCGEDISRGNDFILQTQDMHSNDINSRYVCQSCYNDYMHDFYVNEDY